MTNSAYLILGAILVASPSAAQSPDRIKILETFRKDCPAQSLPDKKLIDTLLIAGGNLAEYCECFAVRFASQWNDSDYGDETALNAKMLSSQKFCLAASWMKNK